MRSREQEVDEGLGGIAASKLSDLATGFILRARPIIVLHNPKLDSTVRIKLKRGLLRHTLYIQKDEMPDKELKKSVSAMLLMTKALREAASLIRQGYIEI